MKRIVFFLLPTLLMVGCKPKERVVYNERVVTDSIAVNRLTEELKKSESINTQLTQENSKLRQENTSLRTNTSVTVVEYDTKGQVNPTTGLYPIARESKSTTETSLRNTVKDLEESNQSLYTQLSLVSEALNTKEEKVKELTNQVIELDKKTSPQSGTNFRILSIAFGIGVLVGILLWRLLGKNISQFFSKLSSFLRRLFNRPV